MCTKLTASLGVFIEWLRAETASSTISSCSSNKGSEIIYTDLQMADYLHPSNNDLTIDQNQNPAFLNKI